MLGTLADVTHQKNQTTLLEEKVAERTRELEKKNQDLEKMNAKLQSFAYVSSHDLQEPLRKIQTFASRIRDKEELSEKGRDYFNRMQKSAQQMQVLIQDLLAYSTTSSDGHAFERTDLRSVVDEVRHDFQEVLTETNGTITMLNSFPVNIIPLQFKQVLHNLVSNSLKFSRDGIPPKIVISMEPQTSYALPAASGNFCKISLIDNGIGFDPKYRDKIFEVFQRLHLKHEYRGTGVGLAIVKRIIENHDGFIEAFGEPGNGSRFDIYLPN
jgi:light-regulated signal transduction histidine kinase (bacteriophytochrome)